MRLQLTDGYYLHFDQLSRMLQYAFENIDKPKINSAEYVEFLGQSPKKVEALRVILIELGLLNSRILTLSEFGKYVAKYDLFFENLSTLWICHYNISSNPENYVWHRFTKRLLPEVNNYAKEDFYKYYNDVGEINKGKSAIKNMHKEVVSIMNAYSRQQFKNLRLLYLDHGNKYQKDYPVVIDPVAFLYCLLLFLENKMINATALTINEIFEAEDTPSKVFHLDEIQVKDILDKLHGKQVISQEKFGDLNQVRFPNHLTKDLVLKEIYGVTELC